MDKVLRGKLKLAKNHFYETDAEGYIISNTNTRLAPDPATGQTLQPKLPASLVSAANDKPYKEQLYDNIGATFIDNAKTYNNSVSYFRRQGKIRLCTHLIAPGPGKHSFRQIQKIQCFPEPRS